MKINPFRPVNHNPYERQVEKSAQPPSKGKLDKVEISTEAKQLQQHIPSISKEREAKIAELKQQVQAGTYTVDPKALAKKMAAFYRK